MEVVRKSKRRENGTEERMRWGGGGGEGDKRKEKRDMRDRYILCQG